MPKKPAPHLAPAQRRQGRPPKPGGRLSQVEVQRAYRARLAAAGRVVRIVDTMAATALSAPPPSIPDFDPTRDGIYEREWIENLRERLHNALVGLENREEDIKRLEQRNAYLESELVLLGQHHTNALKAKILLQNEIADMKRQGKTNARSRSRQKP